MHAAGEEHSIVIESDLYRVEISNRGAVVRSWQLKKFTDDNKPPRTLDLVHADAAQQSGSWPFSLALDDPQQESTANNALFEITSGGTPVAPGAVLHAPAEITLTWSDGHLEVTKHLKFNASYIVDVQTSVTLDGKPLRAAWPGPADSATPPRIAPPRRRRFSPALPENSIRWRRKIWASPARPRCARAVPGTFDFAGIEDLYFAAAFLPPFTAHGDLAETPLTVTGWTFRTKPPPTAKPKPKSCRKWPRASRRPGR